jgi:hypothetical protein
MMMMMTMTLSYRKMSLSLYSASILFGHEKTVAKALYLTGSQEKVGSCPNKMLAL